MRDYYGQVLFFLMFFVVIYGGFFRDDSDHIKNYKRGLQAGAFVVIAQGTLQTYDPPFNRPNWIFWRAVAKCVLVYFVALVFLVFQEHNDSRQLMKHLYPELGVPVHKGMHTYDDNCELEWSNLWDNLDHYYAAHCVNWFLAALIVRDPFILHFWSVYDENFHGKHIMPHLRECWWDHVFVDVLMSNTPAIILGLLTCKILKFKKYDWLGREGKKSVLDWDVFKCHRRFGGIIAIFIVITCNFLTGFFIMNGLWIPPKNNLSIFRLLIWFLASNLAFREIYNDVSTWGTKQRKDQPIGAEYRFLVLAIMVGEMLVSWKQRIGAGNTLDNETPFYVYAPWGITIAALAGTYLYLRFKKNRTTIYGIEAEQAKPKKEKTNSKEGC